MFSKLSIKLYSFFTLLIITIFLLYYYFNSTKSNILFYSSHRNTINEIVQVFKRHHTVLSTTKNAFNYFKIFGYENFINNNLAINKICKRYDLIIICDTIRIGRPFYERIDENCRTKLALQITDRVDRWVKDKDTYFQLIKNLSLNSNVFFIPNNPYEIYYLNKKGIYPDKNRLFLIRPYGVLETKNGKSSSKSNNNTIIYLHEYMYSLKSFLKNQLEKTDKTKFKFFSHGNYGGPKFLRNQKLFIYIPYQYSTMKVFDNAINGVLTAIPSPDFFKIIAKEYSQDFYLMPEILDFIKENSNWTQYFDIYNKNYIDMYVQFNNWNEFKLLVDNNDEIIKKKDYYLKKMNETMEKHYNQVDLSWKNFLHEFYNSKK
jgi:hypothetical protein